ISQTTVGERETCPKTFSTSASPISISALLLPSIPNASIIFNGRQGMLIDAQLWRFLIHHVILFVDAAVGRNPVIGQTSLSPTLCRGERGLPNNFFSPRITNYRFPPFPALFNCC